MSVVLTRRDPYLDAGCRPVLTLAGLEARRYATRVSLWAGWAATLVTLVWHRSDWPGGAYEEAVPLAFGFLALGTFVAGVRTGSRDRDSDAGPLAEEAGLDLTERAAARLVALAAPVLLAVVTAIGVAVVSRVEGGYWLGEGPRRTDTAHHTLAEFAQPVLHVALAGALGVTVGRLLRRPVLGVVAGLFVWTAVVPLAWMWNAPGRYPIAPAQTMPLRVPLPDVRSYADTPATWLVESPSAFEPDFTRSVVHVPTVLLHDLALVGVLLVTVAGVWPSRRAVVRVAGIVLTAVGVVGQYAVSPV